MQEDAPCVVLHVFSVTVPYVNGYTMRSKYIVEHQLASKHVRPVAVTSPFYPGVAGSSRDDVIDGVSYFRCPHPVDLERGRGVDAWIAVLCHRARLRLRALPSALRTRGERWIHGLRDLVVRAQASCRQRIERARRSGPFSRVSAAVELLRRRGCQLWLAVFGLDRAGNETLPRSGLRRAGAVPARLVALLGVVLQGVVRALSGLWGTVQWVAARLGRRATALGRNLVARVRDTLGQVLMGLEELILLRRFERRILEVAEATGARLIHAHTPYRCGVPAIRAARRLGLPVVYEVRGIWEESGAAQGNFAIGSRKYRFWRRKEGEVVRQADVVVTICEQLRDEVIGRGVEPRRTVVVPNAVDPSIFSSPRTTSLEPEQHRAPPPGPCTLGYVGSIRRLEGVDQLVRAAGELARRSWDIRLLIVGEGPDLESLKRLAASEGLGARAVFCGRVPHREVQRYYREIDIFVISRPSLRVTRLVTPLKPLEAMALGKALVMPDLPALRELVSDGQTGLLYEVDNLDDLVDKCQRLIENPSLRESLALAASKEVQTRRTWNVALEGLDRAYAMAMGKDVQAVRG